MRRDALRMSPQQIDPLSWITRPWVTLTLTMLALTVGLVTTLLTWPVSQRPYLDILSIAAIVGACVSIHVLTRPLRKPFGPRRAVVPLGLGLAGLALSAWASTTSGVLVHNWWVPVGLGVIIAACAPFSTVRAIVAYGTLLTAAVGVAASMAFAGREEPWSALSTVFIACSSVVLTTVATAVFCYLVVSNSQRLLDGAGASASENEAARVEAARRAEVTTIARLGTRVAPFLQAVADAGMVTPEDRTLAGQLARQLRSDLVSQANRSWLDSLAVGRRMYVVDPDRRADSMNTAQRAALRGLLLAVINDPSTDSGSLFIELRGQDDGSTAVALSLDLDLPEGRRMMMLAPHYLALKTTVNDISWDPVLELLRFEVPPGRSW